MSRDIREYIAELDQNYNELGEDIVLLEAVLLSSEGDPGFPEEYILSSLLRVRGYILQHLKEIDQMMDFMAAKLR